MTDTVDLAVAKLGNGRCVFKELVVVEGDGYLVGEAKDIFVPFDKVGLGVRVSNHFRVRVDVDEVEFVSTGSNSWS